MSSVAHSGNRQTFRFSTGDGQESVEVRARLRVPHTPPPWHYRREQSADGDDVTHHRYHRRLEREVEEWEFLCRFSSDAYALGINIVVYTPTH